MIFLDTGFLFALVYADDVHHSRVLEVFNRYRDRPLADFVVTSNHVVAETVTLLRNKAGADPRARHALAVRTGQQMLAGTFGKVHHATAEEERSPISQSTRTRSTASSTASASS